MQDDDDDGDEDEKGMEAPKAYGSPTSFTCHVIQDIALPGNNDIFTEYLH